MSMPSYYVLIPAYNAGKYLTPLIQELTKYVELDSILIVDDGSQDDTQEILHQLGVHFILHDTNQGKAGALVSGFKWGIKKQKSWSITMDADGQHSPDDLQGFIRKIKELSVAGSNSNDQFAAILGARDFSDSMPKARVFSNSITTAFLTRLSGQALWDSQCGYRAYQLDLLQSAGCLELETDGFQWESEVLVRLAWAGFYFDKMPIQTIYQKQGSHISHIDDTLKFIKMWHRLKKEKKYQNGNLS